MGLMDWFTSVFRSFHLRVDDIVVFVVGPSGGGKSWFIEEATKSGLVNVSDKLAPSTKNVEAIRCKLTERAKMALNLNATSRQKNIVFVDMPSFHTDLENGVEKRVRQWLINSKYASTLVGTIYVARVETNPVLKPTVQDHLNTFARVFPQHATTLPDRLLAILSYESKLSQTKINNHMGEFEKQVNALYASRLEGAQRRLEWHATFHCELFRKDSKDLSKVAWNVVEELFSPARFHPRSTQQG